MRTLRSLSGVLLFALLCLPVQALEIKGVTLPESVALGADGAPLVLNGAGIRKKFFVKVYIGALYLPSKSRDIQAVLDMPGPKRVLMHFLYDEVSRDKLVDGSNEGFEANQTPAELSALRTRLDRFNLMFETVHKGDRIQLDYLPGEGTRVQINEAVRGSVEGEDFYRALLKVWLGDKPADKGLKEDMLGG